MSAEPQGEALPPRQAFRVTDARQALTVHAEMLRCLLPEFDQISIAVVDSTGDVSSWAQAGDLATDLDRLQYSLGEGPCFDSLAGTDTVIAPYIHLDDRWRRYVPAAAHLGLKSQVAAPLRWRHDKTLGALNLYSTIQPCVGVTAPLIAVALAAQVAGALASFYEVEGLHRAIANRTVIGQATGLVMGRFEIEADQAFAYLRRMSMHHNRKLTHVAQEIVTTRQFPAVGIE